MRLPRWQKTGCVILGILSLLMVAFDVTFYRAFFYNPSHITVTYQTHRDSRIPSSLSQVSLLYLTDLEYNDQFGIDKGSRLFETIRSLNPDVLIFGGDLFAWNADLSEAARGQMIEWIRSVSAPLGKFAVYGEQDLADEAHRTIIDDIYFQSQVELIGNRSVLIANGSAEGIRLGGLDINADPGALASTFNGGSYSVLVSHYPDNLLLAGQAGLTVSTALCGNSHGTQILWPVLGGYKKYDGSLQINRASEPSLPFPYYISSGVGCLNVQARLNAPVELLYITLSQ